MDQPENRIAGGHVLGNDANGEQVINLVKRDFGALDLLENGIKPLDAPFDASLDAVFAKLLDEGLFHAAQELLALHAPGLDGRGNLFVADRIGVAEGQVLKLAAHLAHAQPMRQRGIDVLGLAGDGFLAVRFKVLQVRILCKRSASLISTTRTVGNHGQQHLADVFGLAVLAVGKLDLVDLG